MKPKIRPIDDQKPLPTSFAESWSQRLQWHRDIAQKSGEPLTKQNEIALKDVYYAGARAAIHQLNAGRYEQTATNINNYQFRQQGLSDHDIIEYTDSLIDGTYPFADGYPDASPYMKK